MIETDCYRDLTKKTKIRGLSTNSWIALIIVSFTAWFILVLWAIPIAIMMYMILYILEYFDEDIYDIIFLKFKIKSSKYYA